MSLFPPIQPEPFSGQRDTTNVVDFLDVLELFIFPGLVAQVQDETKQERAKVLYLQQHLEGRAKRFWSSLRADQKTTFNAASDALKKRFPVKELQDSTPNQQRVYAATEYPVPVAIPCLPDEELGLLPNTELKETVTPSEAFLQHDDVHHEIKKPESQIEVYVVNLSDEEKLYLGAMIYLGVMMHVVAMTEERMRAEELKMLEPKMAELFGGVDDDVPNAQFSSEPSAPVSAPQPQETPFISGSSVIAPQLVFTVQEAHRGDEERVSLGEAEQSFVSYDGDDPGVVKQDYERAQCTGDDVSSQCAGGGVSFNSALISKLFEHSAHDTTSKFPITLFKLPVSDVSFNSAVNSFVDDPGGLSFTSNSVDDPGVRMQEYECVYMRGDAKVQRGDGVLQTLESNAKGKQRPEDEHVGAISSGHILQIKHGPTGVISSQHILQPEDEPGGISSSHILQSKDESVEAAPSRPIAPIKHGPIEVIPSEYILQFKSEPPFPTEQRSAEHEKDRPGTTTKAHWIIRQVIQFVTTNLGQHGLLAQMTGRVIRMELLGVG